MASLTGLTAFLSLNSAKFRAGLDKARASLKGFGGSSKRNLNAMRADFLALSSVISGVFAGASFSGIAETADIVTGIRNRLKASGVESKNITKEFSNIQQLAKETRSSLRDTGNLYAALIRTSKNFTENQEEILAVTRAIQQSFVLSGATIMESSNATRQLIQGLQSGTLRGEELNAVLEQAPVITATLTKEFGVSTGQLRQMAKEGKVVSERVFKALLRSSQDINTQMNELDWTFGQIGVKLKNSIAPAMAETANKLKPTVSGFSKMIETFPKLASIGIILATLTAAMLSFGGAWAIVVKSLAILPSFAPLVIAVFGAIAFKVLVLSDAMKSLRNFAFAPLVNIFNQSITVMREGLAPAIESVVDKYRKLVNWTMNAVRATGRFFGLISKESEKTKASGDKNIIASAIGDVKEFDRFNAVLNDTFNKTNETVTENVNKVGDSFKEGFKNFLIGEGSVEDILKGTLDKFTGIIVDQFVGSIYDNIFKEGFGNIFGSLFSGEGDGLFAGLFADGGKIPAGKFGIVGESGAEIVTGPANVVSAKDTSKLLSGGSGDVNITLNVTGDVTEATRQSIRGMADEITNIVQSGLNERRVL